MSLDKQTVQQIAHLAKLEIDSGEIDKYAQELTNILALMAQMEAIDTTNITPMTHPFDATLRLRADQVTEKNQREKFQAIAPSAEAGLYLVPKVLD